MHVAHRLARRPEGEDGTKDIDFAPAGVQARLRAGYADTMDLVARAPWSEASDPIEGVIAHR